MGTKLAVLISGNGSNLQAIIDACKDGRISGQISAVISNVPDAYGLTRASNEGIKTIILPRFPQESRQNYDSRLVEIIESLQVDLVVLAGWMRLLSLTFLEKFPGRVINLHPALPGAFPGVNSIERAYDAFQRGEIEHSGVMVHLVPDEDMDTGPVLASRNIYFKSGETLEQFENRFHELEHLILVETLENVISGKIKTTSG